MRITKKFAPMSLEIETESDLKKIRQLCIEANGFYESKITWSRNLREDERSRLEEIDHLYRMLS